MTNVHAHDQRIELKYIVDTQQSLDIRAWARENLNADPHCDADASTDMARDSYEVNTLYLDTPRLDVFHRSGKFGRTKHRIRRYGQESILWLETKRKRSDVVRKQRTAINGQDAIARLSDLNDDSPWCGDWFATRVARRQLRPVIQVHYQRFARASTLAGECLRLTIDSHLQMSQASGWTVGSTSNLERLDNRVEVADVEVLELKFHHRMPHLFKELLRQFAIPAAGFSKYRTAVTCGLDDSLMRRLECQLEPQDHKKIEEQANV